jgi:putative ABC transport system permease protein
MSDLITQLRYTVRLLLKSPGLTITALLILGFGIGVNTAIFSLINAVILKPLPFPEPSQLVQICQPYQNDPFASVDYPDYVDIATAQHVFSSLAVVTGIGLDLTGSGEPQYVRVDFASASLFKVSGLRVTIGRVFTDAEDVPNGPLLAVLSEHLWKTRFNADPEIVGKNITLGDNSFQVIGVVPAQVNDWRPPGVDVYVPANAVTPVGFFGSDRGYPLALRDLHYFFCVGRLRPGVALGQAQADLDVIHRDLVRRYPETTQGYGLRVTPLLDGMVHNYSGTTTLLAAAAGLLLLISSANVANLLFARGLQRGHEMMIRTALGATRRQLIGQVLSETLILSFLGGISGLLVAFTSTEAIKKLCPTDLSRFREFGIDWTTLLFVLVVTLLTSVLSGLWPAWSLSRATLAPSLRDHDDRTGTSGPRRSLVKAVLVTIQVALACILLTGASILIRSFQAAQSAPLGFNSSNLLTGQINLTSARYERDAIKGRAFWDALLPKIRQLPGVTDATMSDQPPLRWDWEALSPFAIDGQPDPGPGRRPALTWQMVSADYFRTLQVPILQGRDFSAQDTIDKPNVVIVDKAVAESYFPTESPLGKGITVQSWDGPRHCTIVGVVQHIRFKSPGYSENSFQAYFPYTQWGLDTVFLILRSTADPSSLVSAIRTIVASIDPDIPVVDVHTYDDVISEKFVTRRLCALLVTLFSGAALFLSSIGLYGTLAYSVGQRTREIGIRMTLGAQIADILRLITAQGFKIVGVGLLAGIIGAVAGAHLIEGLLYGVSPVDPPSLGISILMLGLAATLACLLPVLKAVRINPTEALRSE